MRYNYKKSLIQRQIMLITPIVLLALFVLVFYLTREAKIFLHNEIRTRALKSTESSAAQLNGIMTEAERLAKVMATAIEESVWKDHEIDSLLDDAVGDLQRSRPEIFGASIAFAPWAHHADRKYCMFYTYFENGKNKHITVHSEEDNYNYFEFDWYKHADLEKGSWSEPYFDEGLGNVLMTTFSYPFFKKMSDGKKKFAGLVTVDISVERLTRYLDSIIQFEVGYPFLLSRSGKIVVHPDNKVVMDRFIGEYSLHNKNRSDEFMTFWRMIFTSGNDCIEYPFYNAAGRLNDYMAYAKLPCNGWVVGVMLSQEQLFAPLKDLQHHALFLASAAVLLAMILLAAVTMRALRPLQQLNLAAKEIGEGRFDLHLPDLKGDDEVCQLNRSFGLMLKSLNQYIEELKITTTAKNKIENELEIARDIQNWILPSADILKTAGGEIEAIGRLRPAKWVGGDLYDVFMISENELAVAIGDVSGKGVPAALFMAVTQSLHRGITVPGKSSAEIVNRINRTLAKNNDMMMFVTYFFAIINLAEGTIQYTNAGHNPPLILSADGKIKSISKLQGPPLAISDHVYACDEYRLTPGDTMILYTDGITEAVNHAGEEFSLDRLKETLKSLSGSSPAEIINSIIGDIDKHAEGLEQYDDITMLAVRFNGIQKTYD